MNSEAIFKIGFLLFIGIAVLFEVAADIFLKKWALENKSILLIVGLSLYFIGTIFWAVSLKYELLSKAVSVFTIVNFVLVVLVGIFLFNEKLSLLNKIGIALGILSVILIEV